jgi:thiamine-monophosphate kinase
VLGIGDDAALLRGGSQQLVWSIDVCLEGVHFRRGWLSLKDLGWRATQAALSDLAAMGARPLGALCSLVLPAKTTRAMLREIGSGQADAARSSGCPIIGGNISRGRELSLTTAVLGETASAAERSGAQPGHELWLVGDVGLAAAGLRILRARTPGDRVGSLSSAEQTCIAAWRRPRALLRQGEALASCASALIDLSDGLAGDSVRIAEASQTRLVLEEEPLRRVLRPELGQLSGQFGCDPLDLALYGGEDYALLATGPSSQRPQLARPIGHVTEGSGAWLQPPPPARSVRLRDGFDHLQRRAGPSR